ncbi:MAG: hypothetical protein AB2A00_23675 [Myxococcota bacterium]
MRLPVVVRMIRLAICSLGWNMSLAGLLCGIIVASTTASTGQAREIPYDEVPDLHQVTSLSGMGRQGYYDHVHVWSSVKALRRFLHTQLGQQVAHDTLRSGRRDDTRAERIRANITNALAALATRVDFRSENLLLVSLSTGGPPYDRYEFSASDGKAEVRMIPPEGGGPRGLALRQEFHVYAVPKGWRVSHNGKEAVPDSATQPWSLELPPHALAASVLRHDNALHVSRVAFSPDSRFLVSADDERQAYVWDLAKRTAVHRFHGDYFNNMNHLVGYGFLSDGTLLVTGLLEYTVCSRRNRRWSDVRTTYAPPGAVHSADVAPTGRVAIAMAAPWKKPQPDLRLLDLREGKLVPLKTLPIRATAVALSADGGRVMVAELMDDASTRVRMVSVLDGTTLSEVFLREYNEHLSLAPDAGRVAVWNTVQHARPDRIEVWDLAEKQAVTSVEVPKGSIPSFDLSPNGKFLVMVASGTARLHEIPDGRELRRWPVHDHRVSNIAFSRDARMLAYADHGGVVHVQELLSGKNLVQPR